MNILNPAPILVCFVAALITISLLGKTFRATKPHARISTIDGLRGYLAMGVFMHHGVVWYLYGKTHEWARPPSNLYANLGEGSVSLFFMITAFLFFSKVLESDLKPINWTQLYISRMCRLLPLYLVAMLGLFLIVGALSNWTLQVSVSTLLLSLFKWLTFTMPGSPNINGAMLEGQSTSTIMASVVWSLRYEWLFYLALPAFTLLKGKRAPIIYLVIGFVGLAILSLLEFSRVMAFVGGMATAVVVKHAYFRKFASKNINGLTVLSLLITALSLFERSSSLIPMVMLTICFALVAGGNSIFGLLNVKASRLLGDLAYGIYIFHGMLLFVVMRFGFGLETLESLSAVQYWVVICAMTPVVVATAFLGFRLVEKPAMDAASDVGKWFVSLGRSSTTAEKTASERSFKQISE